MIERDPTAVPCIIELRRNVDGVVRPWKDSGLDFRGSYIWEDGNFSCDCNRASFFAEAGTEDGAAAWDRPCGDGAFSVRITAADDGRLLYVDGDGWE